MGANGDEINYHEIEIVGDGRGTMQGDYLLNKDRPMDRVRWAIECFPGVGAVPEQADRKHQGREGELCLLVDGRHGIRPQIARRGCAPLRDPGFKTVLVFSRMKHGADRLARSLEAEGFRTATLHSNRTQNQRLRALKDFKSGAVRVLVATDIAARGIVVDGISHVVNYDFPMHPEDYVHRIGRTGRAHAVGDAISFVTPEDHSALHSLERFIGRGIVRKHAGAFNYSASAPASPKGVPHTPGAPRSPVHSGR